MPPPIRAVYSSSSTAPGSAAFGIAGPVRGRAVRTTNLPWFIEADVLQQRFGFKACTLLNDLEATACGLPALGAEDLVHLIQKDKPKNCVSLAGTGKKGDER